MLGSILFGSANSGLIRLTGKSLPGRFQESVANSVAGLLRSGKFYQENSRYLSNPHLFSGFQFGQAFMVLIAMVPILRVVYYWLFGGPLPYWAVWILIALFLLLALPAWRWVLTTLALFVALVAVNEIYVRLLAPMGY